MPIPARGNVYLGGVRFSTDPQPYESYEWPKRMSEHPVLGGSVVLQDFDTHAKVLTMTLGNLTALLKEFDGAVASARKTAKGPASSSDAAFVQAVAEENVRHTMRDIVSRSPVIAELVRSGQVAIAGGVYDLATGKVSWLE